MLSVQLQLRIPGGTPDRKHGKKPPAFQAERYQVFLEFSESIIIPVVDACDHIEFDRRLGDKQLYGLLSRSERPGHTPHPFMVSLKAVETDCGRVYAGPEKGFEPAGSKQTAVGDDSPRDDT